MSIYTRCAQATDELRKSPPADQGGVFTELDIIQRALGGSPLREVMREASNLCGRLYREGKLCRYGPITPNGNGRQDYGRIATKIVYADADLGPDQWETPNGSFPKLLFGADEIAHQRGRRSGIDRHDLVLWEDGESRDELRSKLAQQDRRLRELEAQLAKV